MAAAAALLALAFAGSAHAVGIVVDPSADRRPISPLVYGINDNAPGTLASTRPGLLRLGGNRWSAYNWENNASNAGSDWFFHNDGYLSDSDSPGAAVLPTLVAARSYGAAALVTVPIGDYVAADKDGTDVHDTANYLQTRFKANHAVGGTTFDATDADVYQDEFVEWVKGSAPAGSKVLFSLDNEPDLWAETHEEIHPDKVTYAELRQRNIDYATAIKEAWPGAEVSGPVNYGWAGYVNLQGAPDAGAHGNFLDWYLGQMQAASTSAGKRLVDDLDLHYYSEATGGGVRVTGTSTSPAVVAAREQAPRSLWDPGYVEDSWITHDTLGDTAIRLIPRTKGQIASHYPGTGIALTEWSFGAGQHISGGIATADTLGIFGREGVRAAAFWPLSGNEGYSYAAFAAFRNFDGHGAAFRNTSVRATTSDVAKSSVYASVDSANPGRMVIVAINKSTGAEPTTIAIRGALTATRAAVYRLTGAHAGPVAAPGLATGTPNSFAYTMPAQSVSVIVPALGSGSAPAKPTPVIPKLPKPPKLSKLLKLPSTRRCLRHRTIRIRVRKGAKVKRLSIKVNRKRAKVIRGKRLKRVIKIRLPRGRAKIKFVVRLSDGTRVSGTRRYKQCRRRHRR